MAVGIIMPDFDPREQGCGTAQADEAVAATPLFFLPPAIPSV